MKEGTEICENAFSGCPFQPEACNVIPIPADYQETSTNSVSSASVPTETEQDQTETENSSIENIPTESTSTVTHTGIRPEFKEAMESYEAFFDEYIEFLENYDANDISMLLEYTSFLTQYSDTMNKLDDIDESELSPEENAYFIEVMLRIEQKLITVVKYDFNITFTITLVIAIVLNVVASVIRAKKK